MSGRIERRYSGNLATANLTKGAVSKRSSQVDAHPNDGGEETLPMITGYAAMFDVDTEIFSWYGSFIERISKGAFSRAIKEKQDVRALRNHEADNVLGRTSSGTLRLKEDRTGLYVEIDPPDTALGNETVTLIQRGDISGQSFAFIPRKVTWINGKDGKPDVRIVEDVDLYDVGPVTYPAYEQTTIEVNSASAIHEEGLRALGKPVVKRSADDQPETAPEKVEEVKESDEKPAQIEEKPAEVVESEAPATEDVQIEPATEEPIVEQKNLAKIALQALELEIAKRETNEAYIKLLTT